MAHDYKRSSPVKVKRLAVSNYYTNKTLKIYFVLAKNRRLILSSEGSSKSHLFVLQAPFDRLLEWHMAHHLFLTHQFNFITKTRFFSQSIMSRHSDNRAYQPDTTIPTSHHDTHRVAHLSAPNQPQWRYVIEHLRPQRSPHNGHDQREQLNKRRSSEAKRLKESRSYKWKTSGSEENKTSWEGGCDCGQISIMRDKKL